MARTSYASRGPTAPEPGAYLHRRFLRVVPAEARLAGADDGLGAAGNPELGEDSGDVVADGVGAEEEPDGDPGVDRPRGVGPGLAHAGTPYVVATHGTEYWFALLPGTARALRRATSRASCVLAISRFTARTVRTVVPRHVPMTLAPPGVDVRRFRPDISGDEVRARHGLLDRPIVVCVSRLVRRKGQDVLIEAMETIRRRAPGATLLVVGGGPDRERLERLAAAAPAGSVVFAGEVSDEQLPAYHAAADVFAMPCRSRLGGLEVEGFGIVFLEAGATGKAVVAGDSGGAAEAVEDGETGLVVDGRRIGRVAEAVSGVLLDPMRAGALGDAGRARAEREFAWPVLAERVGRVLKLATGEGEMGTLR